MSKPDTFQEAVIELMKKGRNVRQAFIQARKTYPFLYMADRTITEVFLKNSWFMAVSEAKSMATMQNIPLTEAFKRVYENNPQLAKELLGRDFI